jgi:hypothetical protein
MGLQGKLTPVNLLTAADRKNMFHLMAQYYDDTDWAVFCADLEEKDYCILLFDENQGLQGFSTQKILAIPLGAETVYGLFSGDTIIHKDYWGSLELFKIFTASFFPLGRQYPDFYWFLTTKGYKTYRMLPVFFQKFYPNFQEGTPPREQAILQAFGRARYPREFQEDSGVIAYRKCKDKLKAGVADITANRLQDRHVRYFLKLNPGYAQGNDLVCLARLSEDNLRPAVRRLLLGKGE